MRSEAVSLTFTLENERLMRRAEPCHVVQAWDRWLSLTGLLGLHTTAIIFDAEGSALVEHEARDDDGKPIVHNGEVVRVTERVPLSCLPPVDIRRYISGSSRGEIRP